MNLWRLRREVHLSWLIAAGAVGFIAGVVAAGGMSGSFRTVGWLLTGGVLLGAALWRRRVYAIGLAVAAGCILGLVRGSAAQAQLAVYEHLHGASVTLSGKVSDDPDTGRSSELKLRLGEVQVNGHDLAGKVWLTVASGVDIKRGDRVSVNGKLSEGFGTFAAAMYRGKIALVQRPQPGDVARRARDWFSDGVRRAVGEPAASLGVGYLVGERRALPADLDSALKVAGLTHIVVASGYNLTILVRFARRLLVKHSKYLAALSAGGMIVTFMAVTGLSPSMSRAGLVTGLSLLAWYYGRKFHPLVLLPLAAAVTLAINPSYGWGDIGWQLSFAAFFGVIIVAPLLQKYFFGDKKPGALRQIAGETISAQICTLPITIAAFGVYSNIAVAANLLILPLVPLAMLLTFAAGLGALLLPAAAGWIGLPAEWLLGYMISVAEYGAGLSWAQGEMTIAPGVVGVMYAVILVGCLYMLRRTGHDLREASITD